MAYKEVYSKAWGEDGCEGLFDGKEALCVNGKHFS